MKQTFFFLLFLAGVAAHAQDTNITTVILVRHAEKLNDGTTDPDLSPEGADRATRLQALLVDAGVDAVYSTDYKRTRNTVQPLAEHAGLEVQLYHPADRDALRKMLSANRGKTIVVCGHSNTIPAMANELVREAPFSTFDESDYGNLIIVSVAEGVNAGWLRLRF